MGINVSDFLIQSCIHAKQILVFYIQYQFWGNLLKRVSLQFLIQFWISEEKKLISIFFFKFTSGYLPNQVLIKNIKF